MPLDITSNKTGRNLYSKKVKFQPKTSEDNKAYRAEEALDSVVEQDGYQFNADEDSMNRLDRVIDVANWKYNQAIAGGQTATDAYNAVYVNQMVRWKTADNQWLPFSVETLCNVQEKALLNLETIWEKWG